MEEDGRSVSTLYLSIDINPRVCTVVHYAVSNELSLCNSGKFDPL